MFISRNIPSGCSDEKFKLEQYCSVRMFIFSACSRYVNKKKQMNKQVELPIIGLPHALGARPHASLIQLSACNDSSHD